MRVLCRIVLVLLAGCQELPDLGVCGNGIIEAENGEACDGDLAGTDSCTDTCELTCLTSAVSDAYVVVGVDPTTTPASEQYCPDSRQRCGLDNICRAASGSFGTISPAQPYDVKTSTTGDFDGDRIDDLVGTSATEIVVRFGGAGTPFVDGFEQAAASSESPVAIFDRHPDSIAIDISDLAIGVPTDGLALLSSDTESFKPDLDVSFAIDSAGFVPFLVTDPDPVVGDVVMAVARVSSGGLVVKRIAVPPALPTDVVLGSCGGANSRVVTVAVARDRKSFVVVGRPSTGSQWFACRYVASGTSFAAPAVTSFNTPPPDSAVLADIDGDPCPELVVARVTAVPAQTTVGFARAQSGSCALDPVLAVLAGGTLASANTLFDAGSVIPSASPDPERDEIIMTTGVFRVTPAQALVLVASPTSDVRPWTTAAVVDLNGDGQLDVVAGRKDQDDVDVVRGGAIPNVYRADTTATINATVAGDFDGDFLGDVGLVERSLLGDRVSILYGTADGLVGPALANSRFGGVLQIARLGPYSWGGTTRGADGIDDLVITQTNGMTMTTRAGVLLGDAPRLLTIPRLPPTPVATIGAVVVGKLDGSKLLAAAIDADASGGGSSLLVHDIDANVWSGPVAVAGLEVDITRPPQLLRTQGLPLIATFARGTQTMTTIGALDLTGKSCTKSVTGVPFALHGSDVVGDDAIDELVVGTVVAANRNPHEVHVFAVTGGAQCTIGAELLADQLRGCADVARVGTTTVALCEGAPRQFGVFRISPEGVREDVPFAEVDGVGVALLVGDFDGDAVQDLAVSVVRGAEVSVQFLRQCPAHDTRACR